MQKTVLPMAVSPREAAAMLGVGKTLFYALVKRGAIQTKKVGARTIVPVEGIKALLNGLPDGGGRARKEKTGGAGGAARSSS